MKSNDTMIKQKISKGPLNHYFSSDKKKCNRKNSDADLDLPSIEVQSVSPPPDPQSAAQIMEGQNKKKPNMTDQASKECDQVFQKAPPYCEIMGRADSKVENACFLAYKPTTDWSQNARKNLKYDPDQNRITDFYSIADKVEVMISSSPRLVSVFKFSPICTDCPNQDSAMNNINNSTFHSFFATLVQNAYKNVDKSVPQSRRYDVIIKKFSTSLLLYSGPMAYNFIQKNMENALPSLRTVQRIIKAQYHSLSEGEFQFDGLVQHLTKYKAPLVISVSEDATRITARVEYDKETNRMLVLFCHAMKMAYHYLILT